ncbi:MAG: hypothetical protein HEEMFOPI_01311 [Holosporales bacterium]
MLSHFLDEFFRCNAIPDSVCASSKEFRKFLELLTFYSTAKFFDNTCYCVNRLILTASSCRKAITCDILLLDDSFLDSINGKNREEKKSLIESILHNIYHNTREVRVSSVAQKAKLEELVSFKCITFFTDVDLEIVKSLRESEFS